MKTLKDILIGAAVNHLQGNEDLVVNEIVFDSRKIKKGNLFVAQKGVSFDGHLFITKAIDLGALVIVCEDLPEDIVDGVTYVVVSNANVALSKMAANFYENPSTKLKLVGVTGTNGKTTVATLLYELFQKAGYVSGLLSTVKVCVGEENFGATHTTPDSLSINKYLAAMVAKGVTHCFMEVSSHGIHQSRIEGLVFDGAVFTNLSHDHLDYHKTFLEYRNVKKKFFDDLGISAFALTNRDDKNGEVMLQNTKARKVTYALKTLADYRVKILERTLSGMLLNVNGQEVWVQLIGDFNAYNLLAVFGVASQLGLDENEILRAISELRSVSGRFEYTISKGGVVAIVDYAHTPDALKNVLETIEGVRSKGENIITVMGCGGDRDQDKRKKMGKIGGMLSNQLIITSDNPRFENPQVIVDQIEEGVAVEDQGKTLVILDRKQAIKTACKLAKPKDIILIAGKGHETYQDIQGEKVHFDDREVVQEIFEELKK